jgi:hypothetical protein
MERPRLIRGVGLGLLAALAVAAVGAALRGILDLSAGIIAVAVAGGWFIGAATRHGAWDGQPHRPSAAPTVAGAALGAVCWAAGLVGAWLVAMAILPGSSRTFTERLAATPFLDWLSPQVGIADVLSLLLLVVFGATGTRSAATRD